MSTDRGFTGNAVMRCASESFASRFAVTHNGDMYMSAELIATLSAFITLGIGMFAGFAWVLHRMDAKFDSLDHKIDGVGAGLTTRIDDKTDSLEAKLMTRIDDKTDSLEAKLMTRIDQVDTKLSTRIDSVQSELVEVKIAIARIEPPRHLIAAR
ncbi:hypothetical protein L2X99_10580 [Microbacterium sp. KUDC0406]|uniref:hypothetical protein n=1 Tax=Microbacterium sp. KUDC0406 TaxID=2909588 RepID=UPI001F1623EB|nr:hypothetical protein [Microbacterium sp. KUDC0406]UJP08927.1 hypothetical protein L2X99_10580 [Microbacterium sp. KUDC0406]